MANIRKKLYALSPNSKYGFRLPLGETITVGKREYHINIMEDDKYGTYIFWKNRRYPVEIVRSRQNKYEILFNDISYTFTIETPFSIKRKMYLSKESGKSERERITAPMPGKIIDLLVKEGAEITRGEPLLILEAMKMQNEIQSPVNGIVISVNATPGTNVNKDDLLVDIKITEK